MMLKYIRYTLAALCLAASVGCLALWGWSMNHKCVTLGSITRSFSGGAIVVNGLSAILFYRGNGDHEWEFNVAEITPSSTVGETSKRLFTGRLGYYFPLWFPTLVFALAAIASLRLGRFTIRSALIATTIAAALLGMVVAL